MGPGRRRGAAVLPAGHRARHHLLGHRERLPGRHLGGGHRPRDQALFAPRGHRAGHQGVRQDARRPRRIRPVPQGHHGADRRLPDPAGYRLRRPVPDPPLRPRDPGRRDDGGPARRRQSRQGPLPRRVVDVRLAVRQAAARRRAGRLDPVRVHAEPVQPAAPPGRAGADGHVRRHRRRPGALLPAGQRPPGPPLGRAVHPVQRRPRRAGLRLTPRRARRQRGTGARRAPAASPWPRSRWPGCCATRPSPPRSSARPDRITCPKPSPRSS